MVSPSPLVQGIKSLSYTQLACPGELPAPDPGQGAQLSAAHDPTFPMGPLDNQGRLSDTSGSRRALQTLQLQPGHPVGSQTSLKTHDRHPGPHPGPLAAQPKPGSPVPTVSAALEGGKTGEGGGGEGRRAAQGMGKACGVCGRLLLAVVLAACSPLVALGVCVADIVTGDCCNVDEKHTDFADDLT